MISDDNPHFFARKVLQAGFMYACEIQRNVTKNNEAARASAAVAGKTEVAEPLTFKLRDPNETRRG